MAKYRPVWTKIWKDPDFINYSSNGKLIFIYLCTNDLCSESGIYPISQNTISFETAIPLQTVSKLLANGLKNVYYEFDHNIVFVKNFRNYSSGGNPNLIIKAIVNDFEKTKYSTLWDLFIKEYPQFKEEILKVGNVLSYLIKDNLNLNLNLKEGFRNGLETVCLDKINQIVKDKGLSKRKLTNTTYIKARLNDGFSETDIIQAFKNCSENKWHLETGKIIDLEYIFRKSKFEGHLNLKPVKPINEKNDPFSMINQAKREKGYIG